MRLVTRSGIIIIIIIIIIQLFRFNASLYHICPGKTDIRQINLLTPNVNYGGRTAPLTSKVAFYIFIQQI